MRNKIKNVLPTVFKATVIGAIYAIFSWIYFELAIRCDFYSCFAGIYDYFDIYISDGDFILYLYFFISLIIFCLCRIMNGFIKTIAFLFSFTFISYGISEFMCLFTSDAFERLGYGLDFLLQTLIITAIATLFLILLVVRLIYRRLHNK